MALFVTVVYDANILYPAALRDLFMRLAQAGLVRARWTEQIHDEWERNLLRNRPDLSRERLERTRKLMNQAVRDCLVTGYDHLIDSLELPDPNDRHVLAAAIQAGASIIVTSNLKDFPRSELARHGIRPLHPDELLLSLLELDLAEVCAVVKKWRQSLHSPSRTARDLLAMLQRQGLARSVQRLEQHIALL